MTAVRRLCASIILTALVLAAAFGQTSAPALAAEALSLSISSTGDGTARLVIELTGEPERTRSAINTPPRLIIDLSDTTLRLPDDVIPVSPVKAVRTGTMPGGTARLVLDMDAPSVVAREFYLPPTGGAPGRLVFDIAPEGTVPALPVATAPAAAPVTGGPERVVVIDPGHGGIDPGAVTESGLMEKTIALDFAKRLAERLGGVPGVRVELTRTDDRFLSLNRRIRIARAFGADLFISIHADAAPQDYVRGATVYTVAERPSDAQAAELAARENTADMVSGLIEPDVQEDVSGILASLLRQETQAMSHTFASLLVATMSPTVEMNSNPHRQARFRVLQAYDIPSVLLELGYLTNKTDVDALIQADWQERTADAVARAITVFLESNVNEMKTQGG